MGLEAVLEKILEAGEAECRALIKEAEEKAAEIRNRADSVAKALEKENAESVAAETDRLTTQELSSAEIEARKLVLNAQKEILDRVRAAAVDALAKLPAKGREAILKKLLGKAQKDLPDGILRCAPGDVEIIERNSKYSLGDPIETAGGFIVSAPDGSLTLDMRFENLLEDFWNRRLKDITGQLFGES